MSTELNLFAAVKMILMIGAFVMTSACSLLPPRPQKINQELRLHEDTRVDPYFWMNQRDTEPVLSHLAEENAYFEQWLKPHEQLKTSILEELQSRIAPEDQSLPVKRGPWLYYQRFEAGKEYPIICRTSATQSQASEQVLLDLNELAQGKSYYQLGALSISPDHNTLAFAIDEVGRRIYTIYFKDLRTSKNLAGEIRDVTGNMAWANDNQTLLYTQQNLETLRSEKVFRYHLPSQQKAELYFEEDERFNVSVSRSLSGAWLFVESSSFDGDEVRYVSADQPLEELRLFQEREAGHEYSVVDSGKDFFILSNWKAENFRVFRTAYGKTAKGQWQEFIAHSPDHFIEYFEAFKDQLVLVEREQGLTQIKIIKVATRKQEVIKFPDPSYVVKLGLQGDFDQPFVRLDYESLVQPPSTYDYVFATKNLELKKIKPVPGYTSDSYVSERIWAVAKDGTRIPISILHKKDFRPTAAAPMLVYGYGSYGISMDPSFRPSLISLIDRGFVFAIAHIRGGSEMGRNWYESGRLMQKKNTFSDFIAATEHLVEEKYGHPKKVFAMGGSAGGLLMGAVVNDRPDLYKGIIAQVPFVDVLTTMLDTSIPLTVAEYDQWGNPNEKEAYDYIKSYSPYDNLKAQAYPSTLVMTGYHDSQVQYWEPAKWVAKMRDLTKSEDQILFRVDMEAGHSGTTGRFKSLEDTAIVYTFLLSLTGQ